MGESDEVLVTRARRGDRAAFEELVRRTARLIYARIYLEVGDVQRAEDLVQETFLRAWRSLGQVVDPKGFRAWLDSVAHSAVVDSYRHASRKKRAGQWADADRLEGLPGRDPEPAEAAEMAEAREQALSVLRSLPEEYRLPLMLRYLAGSDYETISRQLGMSNGRLRGLLHRGLVLLRAEMKRAVETRRKT